jgi:hypothetical protein
MEVMTMNDVTALSAEALLAIRPSEPEHLFTGDEAILSCGINLDFC